MAQFSGAVKLADLNDYLGPSQSCVKPLMKVKGGEGEGHSTHQQGGGGVGASVRIQLEGDERQLSRPPRRAITPSNPTPRPPSAVSSSSPSISSSPAGGGAPAQFPQLRVDPAKKTATVSLNDCLACSGCVTSAETVLIQQQSLAQLQQLLATLREPQSVATSSANTPPSTLTPPPSVIVLSLSPQSRASLAHHFSLSPLDVSRKLTTFLRSVGVAEVFDAASTLDFSLLEAQREFVQHYQATRTASNNPSSHSPTSNCPPSALPLPLLTSECPGWVCYAEKTQGAYLLPHMSKIKSPQQVMGVLIKGWWASTHRLSPSQVFHVSVQPCPDKKLEAARPEFAAVTASADHSEGSGEELTDQRGVRDVDLVLSTTELLQLIDETLGPSSTSFAALASSPLSTAFNSPLRTSDSASSGGYADHVFRHAAVELFGVEFPPGPLPWVQSQRSTDSKELSLWVGGRRVLHFALLYGFRHLQGLVKAMKGGKAEWDYVEVMACPGSCVNGGGQIKAASKELRQQKELVRQVGELYRGPQEGTGKGEEEETKEGDREGKGEGDGMREVGDSDLVREVYGGWVKDEVGSEAARRRFHTTFKAIEPTEVNPLTIGW